MTEESDERCDLLPTDAEPAKLILGDCLEVMRRLPDGCIDAVICDPPYGQTNERYDGPKVVSLRPEVWAECFRVCRPNAALVSFAGSPTYHRVASAIEAGGWRVRQMWAWIYRDGLIASAYPKEGFDRLAPAIDPIVFATRGKVLLTLEREGPAWENWGKRGESFVSSRASLDNKNNSGSGHWPRSVVCSEGIDGFQFFQLSRGSDRDDRTGHPNQKPTSLMQWIVSKVPGAVILDPFAGSFTTAVACLREGRQCLGIEKEPAYVEIANARLARERETTKEKA